MTGTAINPSLPDLESLSLTEQVAQMVVVRTCGYLFDHQIRYPQWEATSEQLQYWLGELGVGGVILLGGSAGEVGLRSQQLQSWAKLPLLIAADIEEGVGQRFGGATWFPPPMALSAIAQRNPDQAMKLAEQMGTVTAREALALGLNWILAPVVDVNNNPDNPVINVRAFSQTPETVSQLTTAFIRGAQRHPILTTAKHFPGHGDTALDSHLELPTLSHDLSRLDQVELPPFKAAIAAGVDAVMTAHLQIPALDADYPATLSPMILTRLLRQEMGFAGLVVTDALIMGAIAQRYGVGESAVLAVEAGADVLLMPADPELTIRAVCDAVGEGRIAPERIRDSVERIWRAKYKVGTALATDIACLHAWEQLPPPPVQLDQVAQPDAIDCARQISEASLQAGGPLPLVLLDPPCPLRNLILVDQVLDCPFLSRNAPAIAVPQGRGYQLHLIDAQSAAQSTLHLESPPTLLQLFIRGNPFRGSAAPTQIAQEWFQALLETHNLQALVIYGSPYVLDQFLPNLPAQIPYVFSYGQIPEAQAIALHTLFGVGSLNHRRQDNQFTT